MSNSNAGFVCPREHQHGKTANCYHRHGCRCADCRTSRRDRAAHKRGVEAAPPAAPVLTLALTADEVPLLAAAALDRALWLEKDGGNHHGSAPKAATLRRIHKTLATHHRATTNQGATP